MVYIYPKISNCLIYKRYDEELVEITDYLTEEVLYLGIEEAKLAKKLDGKTHPYDIKTTLTKEEVDYLVEELDNCGLLKENKKRVVSGGTVLRTVWEVEQTRVLKVIAFLCNNLLLLLWLPALVIGILMFKNNWQSVGFEMVWFGVVVGLGFGVIFHEFGHAFAGISYGARVFEMGVLTMYYIIPGAYVILDEKTVRNRLKRVQIDAAGVEMNLLLAGIFLMLGAVSGNLGGMFLNAALQNIFLAVMNLTLIKGLDGMAIANELLGAEDAVGTAKDVMFSREKRRKLKERGAYGSVAVAACYMVCVFQMALPLVLLLNVLEVVVCLI